MKNKNLTCEIRTVAMAMVESDLIESKTEEFLKAGGVIKKIGNNICTGTVKGEWMPKEEEES